LFYLFVKIGQQIKYKEPVTVTANFMQYACGNRTLNMKVVNVNKSKFSFLVSEDIQPIPATKIFNSLYNYIVTNFYAEREKSGTTAFQIQGKLHRYSDGILNFSCSTNSCFEVDKIKIGSKEWAVF
jgi:hypothetical protein